MVAASKRADARPRSASSPLVTQATKPSTEGTLAAVEAPSRTRVRPSKRQAAHEQRQRDDHGTGQVQLGREGREDDGHEAEQRTDLHDAVMAHPVGQDAEGR